MVEKALYDLRQADLHYKNAYRQQKVALPLPE